MKSKISHAVLNRKKKRRLITVAINIIKRLTRKTKKISTFNTLTKTFPTYGELILQFSISGEIIR